MIDKLQNFKLRLGMNSKMFIEIIKKEVFYANISKNLYFTQVFINYFNSFVNMDHSSQYAFSFQCYKSYAHQIN